MLYFFMVAHKAACQTLSNAFLNLWRHGRGLAGAGDIYHKGFLGWISVLWCSFLLWNLPVLQRWSVCLWIIDPHSRTPNTSHRNEVLPQDTTHLIQRPCYQRGSPCQDPADNRTTRTPPDHRKETQTAVVWTCLPVIRSGQNHFARHSERGRKTRQTEEEVGRQH